MILLPFRAGHRAVTTLGLVALAPACLISAVTLTVHPALALRQDAKADEKRDDKTYTLARTFKAKEVNRYKIGLTTNVKDPQSGNNVDIVLAMVIKETTKEIKENGNAILVSQFDSASFKLGENDPQDLSALMPSITNTMDKQGHVLETKLEGGNPAFTQGPGANMFNSINQQSFFPTKPIKVGETWKIDVPAKDKNAPKITGTATLVGTDTLNGLAILKLKIVTDSESKLENPQNPGEILAIKAHSEGTSNVDAASGKLIKMTSTTTSDGGPFGKSKSEISFALVTEDKTKLGDGNKADTKQDGKKTPSDK